MRRKVLLKMNSIEDIVDPGCRYDFQFLFDATDSNPNGDPDAGNMPRVDPETMQGIVTDVCLKRKIRNYIDLVKSPSGPYDLTDSSPEENGYGIFVRSGDVALNTKIEAAWEGEEAVVDEEAAPAAKGKGKAKKSSQGSKDYQEQKQRLCRRYYDIRMFGAVLGTGNHPCGMVRGPMQLTMSRSVDPVLPVELTITRVVRTKDEDNKETEMGTKPIIYYGLYRGGGFYSPKLAEKTGVTSEDLRLFWQALIGLFDHDHAAARGLLQMQKIFVFKHASPLGNYPSGKLFDLIEVTRKPGIVSARSFKDYEVTVRETPSEAVSLVELL